jgi:hypothetical protein
LLKDIAVKAYLFLTNAESRINHFQRCLHAVFLMYPLH